MRLARRFVRYTAPPPPSTPGGVSPATLGLVATNMLRYHEQPRAVPVPGRAGEGRRLALSGELHTLGYYSTIVCLGEPGQPYDLIVDTGSSITAVRPPRPPRPPHAPLPPHPPRTLTVVTPAAPAARTRHGGSLKVSAPCTTHRPAGAVCRLQAVRHALVWH